MSDRSSRREFLGLIGASSSALLLSGLGCSDAGGGENGGGDDAGHDAGHDAGDSDANGTDAGSPDADATGPDADAGQEICEATGSDIEGPFHEQGAPERTALAGEDEPGEPLVIEGTVYGPDCETPLKGAMLDVWQADVDGNYHGGDADDYRLRGQMMTDDDGTYRFETIKPGNYPMPGGTMRPAHIHFTITKPGYQPLTTQLYFEGDPHLASDDPCGTCNSGDPTLIIALKDKGDHRRGVFDIVMEKG